jgi:hypothetical protein
MWGPFTRPRRYWWLSYAVETGPTRAVADLALDDGVEVRHNYIDYAETISLGAMRKRTPSCRGRARVVAASKMPIGTLVASYEALRRVALGRSGPTTARALRLAGLQPQLFSDIGNPLVGSRHQGPSVCS